MILYFRKLANQSVNDFRYDKIYKASKESFQGSYFLNKYAIPVKYCASSTEFGNLPTVLTAKVSPHFTFFLHNRMYYILIDFKYLSDLFLFWKSKYEILNTD